MCSMYWTLIAEVTCPSCGTTYEDEMQTHWMGEAGSCVNYYRIGQPIPELAGVATAADAEPYSDDAFWTECPKCEWSADLGVEVENGVITRLLIPQPV